MRSHTTTGALRLPIELWYEILDADPDIDIETLHNVSLTCRRFRRPAQALIFRIFELNCDDDEVDLSRHSARLDFYSSDAIAPFVCEFNLEMSGGIQQPEFTTLVAKFFDALHHFTVQFVLVHSLKMHKSHSASALGGNHVGPQGKCSFCA
jgi:hypothetical protein